MEEKKQTKNKLSYSVFGKHFRGFLCMVTFCVFCVSVILSIYAVGIYGTEIIVNPVDNYEDTDGFQQDITNEMGYMLSHCNVLAEQDMLDEELKILDMSNQKIHYYEKSEIGKEVYHERFNGRYLEDLKVYEQREPLLIENTELMNYESMKEYLSNSDYPCDYVYFDKETFRKVFEKDGLKNTNHRFSEDFSEEAYFVFENYEMFQRDVTDDEVTFIPKEESTTEVAEEYELNEDTEERDTVDKEIVTQQTEIVITPYSFTSYAVYDPKQEIYYSTTDDYFSEMETYIYRADDLLSYIESDEDEGINYNSLVIPLLRSYNTSMQEVAYSGYDSYVVIEDVQSTLNVYEEYGIYYYLQTNEDSIYANIENEEQLKGLGNYYLIEKDSSNELQMEHSSGLPDVENFSVLEDYFEEYPVGTVFGFAWEHNESPLNYYQASFVCRSVEYPFYRDYTLIFVIMAASSLFLLLVQTIWLLRTTGKKYKGDKEVSLNFFDKLYTEIWVGITCIIQFVSVIIAYGLLEEAGNNTRVIYIAACTVLAALVFGFCFMMLTLSFARRIKARNLWNRLLSVKLVKYIINKFRDGKGVDDVEGEENTVHQSSALEKAFLKAWNGCKERIYAMKGTEKLVLVFVILMVVEFIVVFVRFNSTMYREISIFIFLCLQFILFFVVMWVIKDIDKLVEGVKEITKGNLDSKVEIDEKISVFGELAHGINHIGDGLKNAVETSLKDERMKTELITNVSHDLKTPLTSIINYIDLLKKEEIPGEDAKHYIDVLDTKSQRLKQLTEDLVEAAKATSGNIELEMMPLTFDELMKQALGEFEDKYEKRNLTIVASYPEEPAVVMADGRRLFRIIENVLQNIYKYAMEGTRVYADLSKDKGVVTFTLKNVSAAPLNISPEELMERFTRGDASRTTEGSGLGLSIAKDLTRLQNGEFEIQLDGDLFKVIIQFPEYGKVEVE